MNLQEYCKKFRDVLEQHGNAENAQAQKAYMRDKFDYFGMKAPVRKELTRDFLKAHGLPAQKDLAAFAHQMWAWPERELQYACIDILVKFKNKVGLEMLPVYRFLIENKSWWDTVDLIASHLMGALVKKYPELQARMDAWSEEENFWIRRTAILHQLKYKEATDAQRLFTYCEKNLHDEEFFIRKAIGWALREYAKQNETAVRQFVADHPDLSGLSKREALKGLE